MRYDSLSDSELFQKTKQAAENEKAATVELLEYLFEVDRRRLYADRAYGTLFDFVVRELGYSEAQATDRVNTVRLMRDVPEVKDHLIDGGLSLTTTSQIQRFIKAECKAVQEMGGRYASAVSAEKKAELVQACLHQSKRTVEKFLLSQASEEGRVILQERVRAVTEDRTELKFSVGAEVISKLERLRELVGRDSLEKTFDLALDALISREEKKRGAGGTKRNGGEDPAPESPQPPDPRAISENMWIKERILPPKPEASDSQKGEARQAIEGPDPYSRFIPIAWKRAIYDRSRGQCEFVDPRYRRRCTSRYRLEIDHIRPLAEGGKTELSNLRHLCHQHNQREAQKWGLGINLDQKNGAARASTPND